MLNQSHRIILSIVLFSVFSVNTNAADNSYTLPLNLAIEAAQEAVRSCESLNYRVSVAVVDFNGQTKVQLKGDNSPVITKDTSYRKAYTVITLGSVFSLDTSAKVAEMLAKNPNKDAFLTVPNITPLPGAVAIKVNNEIVAAIGVGGAPGGEKDEVCARAGIMKIADRLPL